MLESFNSGKFEYKRLTEEEQKQRGILGRLKGIIADTKNSTRNGRKYSSTLWENVFNNDVMKEKIANRVCFGELGHPVDREETDMEKIAICLAEQPKMGDDGKIYGVFDILSTPNGRILKSLCDYGCNIGVSSRGTGDLYTDDEGNEAVDPDTYNCECWDAVLVPAVKEARMQYVTESLEKKKYNKTLRQSLQESIEKASEEDKIIMNEALDNLGINLTEEKSKVVEACNEDVMSFEDAKELFAGKGLTLDKDTYNSILKLSGKQVEEACDSDLDERLISTLRDSQGQNEEELEEECNNESCSDKDDAKEVVNDKSGELVAEFQEALLKIKSLEDDNLSLQEKLSVCNAKENQLQEQLDKYKKATINLSESAKQVKSLNEDKEKLTENLNKQTESASINKARITSLIGTKKELISQLTEAKATISDLNNNISSINEQLEENSKQLEQSKQTIEKYRKNYAALKESYIEIKAANYGISKTELKTNLKESYSIKDVDSLCEELAEKKSKLSKLPFVINENTNISFKKSEKESIMNESLANSSDDYVSDSLLQLANLR